MIIVSSCNIYMTIADAMLLCSPLWPSLILFPRSILLLLCRTKKDSINHSYHTFLPSVFLHILICSSLLSGKYNGA